MHVFHLPFNAPDDDDARPARKPTPVAAPPPPRPRPFDFGFTARRPLVPLPAVLLYLNKNAREVLTLIEDGRLRWAFDIRSSEAAARQIRVWRQSLFEYTGLQPRENSPRILEEAEFAEIIRIVVPGGFVPSPETLISCRPPRPARIRPAIQRKPCAPAAPVHRLLFPQEPVLWATEIARCLSCTPQHVRKLAGDNSLRTVNAHRAPKSSCLITRASFIEFLKQRRLP
jgi:hypothetical protein